MLRPADLPIRWRLALLMTALAAAILVAGGVVVEWALEAQSRDHFDRVLTEEVREFVAASSLISSSDDFGRFADEFVDLHRTDDDSALLLGLLPDSGTTGLELPDDVAQLKSSPDGAVLPTGLQTLEATNGERYRVASDRFLTADGVAGMVLVGEPLSNLETVVGPLRLTTLAVVLVGLVIAAYGAYYVSGSSLAPLRRISRLANATSEQDLSRRLDHEGPDDEVGELAVAFDRMVDRLDRAFLAQQRLLSDVAHQLRTPITLVRGHLDLLRMAQDRSKRDRDEIIELAIAELDHINRLLGDLLLLERSSSAGFLRPEVVSVAEVVEDVMEDARTLGGRRWVFAGDKAGEMMVDRAHLHSVLLNLLRNAVQHTEPKDTIGLAVFRQGDTIKLQVWDTGEGIPSADLPHVFERFYRGETSQGTDGAGLGLAIVKRIVEAHGGTVSAESRPGAGSVFAIRLPAEQPAPDTSPAVLAAQAG